MRTPLNSLITGLTYLDSLLKGQCFSVEDAVATVLELKQSCHLSIETLNQLMTYDLIESGLQKLFKKKFAVLPFIIGVINQFALHVSCFFLGYIYN